MEIPRIGPQNINDVSSSLPYKIGMPGKSQPVHVPDALEIRRRIAREYGIRVLDSDVKFAGAEVAAIEETLREIKKKKKSHLIGVKEIVKNREYQVRLIKAIHVHAGGAYDASMKRVYIFDEVPPEDLPGVLIHEIGHAVNHFNLEFKKFMKFVKDSGYNMTEFRKFFIPGNRLYQIGAKMVGIPKEEWKNLWERFSMDSLAENRDVFGEIVLEPRRKPKFPWEKNPLEMFAWAYEWYIERNPEFQRLAKKAALAGDQSWLKEYEFLKEEVFEEN